jgi:hypothetical protein
MEANPRVSASVHTHVKAVIASLAATALLVSCTVDGEEHEGIASSARAQVRPYMRGCDETVWGRLDPGYRAESTNVGPLTFVRLPRLVTSRREIREGLKVYSTKVLVTLRKGHRALVEVRMKRPLGCASSTIPSSGVKEVGFG